MYQFLEDYLGVRFLTADHTHVPPVGTSRKVSPVDRSYHPPVLARFVRYGENKKNPAFATRLRINTIYTNITNLPIETKNEHLWVRDFCAMCKKCIRSCPVDAIFDQPVPRGDGGMQCIDHDSCRDYFNENYGCAVCLVACPFSQAGYEKVKFRFRGNPEAPQFRIPLEKIG